MNGKHEKNSDANGATDEKSQQDSQQSDGPPLRAHMGIQEIREGWAQFRRQRKTSG